MPIQDRLSRRSLITAASLGAGALATGVATASPALASPAPATPPPPTPRDGWRETPGQLFLDDDGIAATAWVSRVVHPGDPVRNAAGSRALLRPGDKPWEPSRNALYGSAIYDQAVRCFKMWYLSLLPTGGRVLCYATSKDGVSWSKDNLGVFDYQGSRDNNIVYTTDSAAVIKDDAATDPGQRYKMLSYGIPGVGGYCTSVSPDGLHWTPIGNTPALPSSDVCRLSYDPYLKRYLATIKVQGDPTGRAAYLSTSTDFLTWTTPTPLLRADDRDRAAAVGRAALTAQIYGMPLFTYRGAYLALPWVFDITALTANNDGIIRVQFASSRTLDGLTRDDRTPVVAPTVDGAFDGGMILGTASDVIVHDDRIWLYYSGFNVTHNGPADQKVVEIGAVTWRLDGFVSMSNGGDTPGYLTTTPFLVDSPELRVNCGFPDRAPRNGRYLTVEVLDQHGAVLPGYAAADARPIIGDDVDAQVSWREHPDLTALRGKTVALRFNLLAADLYSYRLIDNAHP